MEKTVQGIDDNQGVSTQLSAEAVLKQIASSGKSPKTWLLNLLAGQCVLGQAKAGAVFRKNNDGNIEVLVTCPEINQAEVENSWLMQCAGGVRQVFENNADQGQGPGKMYGVKTDQGQVALMRRSIPSVGDVVEAFVLEGQNRATIRDCECRLALAAGLSSLSNPAENTQTGALRLQSAIEVLVAINKQKRFGSTIMALCNEMASQWKCDRVSIGFLKGRYTRVKAISHTGRFSRKTKVVQCIEAAMEECLDQDVEVFHPASAEATFIARAAETLGKENGAGSVLSVPLRLDGQAQAVVTLERAQQAFDPDTIEAIRLTCDLCAPRILYLRKQDRWFIVRWVTGIGRGLGLVLGPTHTLAKLAGLALIGFVAFTIWGQGNYRAKASFVFEATVQQSIVAPFDGYIKSVHKEIGDIITEQDIQEKQALAELDTAELRLQLAAAKAEVAGFRKQADAYMRDNRTAEAQMALADVDRVQAQIDLLDYRIGQAKLISPISGTVVTGDLKQQIGAPVKTGDVLFEVTPLASLQAELLIPEDQILDIALNQKGYLATASFPDQRIAFEIERINPMAEVVNNRNVFKVRAHLSETRPWMRPGMEGVAKVDIGKRSYIRIWTRKVVNWLRMVLWI